jgi:branched-chain amino acid transport system ATP-binding protein
VSLLEVEELRLDRAGWPVLEGVSFDLEEGEFVAVAGPRGAGKTALLSCVAGLTAPSGGRISFDGRPVAREDASQRLPRGIAIARGARRAGARLHVEDHLRLGGWAKRLDRVALAERQRMILAVFPTALARRAGTVSSLSPLDRVLLDVARALIADPRLMLVDSPTERLTAEDAEAVTDALLRVNGDGVAVLVAGHSGPVIASAPRVLVLDHGRVVAEGRGSAQHERLVRTYLGTSA